MAAGARRLVVGFALTVVVGASAVGCIPAGVGAPKSGIAPGGISNAPPEQQVRELALARALGATWIRLEVAWGSVERERGVYDWSNVDRLVGAARAQGLSVLANITYSPAWARDPACASTHLCPPQDPADFAAFAAVVAQRYRALGVDHFEIWNEPNKSILWRPKPDAAAYSRLLQATFPAIKAANPGATVITGGTAPAPDAADGSDVSAPTFLRRMYEAGAKGSFDAVGHHPYGWRHPIAVEQPWNAFLQTRTLHQIMAEQGDGAKLIWGTEVGAATGTTPGFSVSEERQASAINDYFSLWLGWEFTGPLFIFSLRDTSTSQASWTDNMGLLRRDFSAKPAADAFAFWAGGIAPSAYATNERVDDVTVGGDQHTDALGRRLARLFSDAPGCSQRAHDEHAQPLDGWCVDEAPDVSGLQPSYGRDAEGTQRLDLNPDRDIVVTMPAIGSEGATEQLLRRGQPTVWPIEVARVIDATSAIPAPGLRAVEFARAPIVWAQVPETASAAVGAIAVERLADAIGRCSAGSPAVDDPLRGGNGNGRADWGDLGGDPGLPIVTWAAAPGSQARVITEGLLGIDTTGCIPPRYRDGNVANGERVLRDPEQPVLATALAADADSCATELPGGAGVGACALGSLVVTTMRDADAGGGRGGDVLVGGVTVTPDEASIASRAYPLAAPVEHQLRRDRPASDSKAAAARRFADVEGFVCRPSSAGGVDERTGRPYADLVAEAIRTEGFVPLPDGPSGPGLAWSRCRITDG